MAVRWHVVTDADDHDDVGPDRLPLDEPIRPTRAADRLKRTVPGAILAGTALARRDLVEGRKDEEPPIVQEAPGDPPGDRAVEVDLDPDDPAGSSVLVRPHLFDDDPEA